MHGAISPLPQFSFMSWRLVKAQERFYSYLDEMGTSLYQKMLSDPVSLRENKCKIIFEKQESEIRS
jgi:hypothetical protein